MTKETWKGSRVVRTNDNNGSGYGSARYYSTLWVNNGDTCTTRNAYHKTLTGAISWANKVLGILS